MDVLQVDWAAAAAGLLRRGEFTPPGSYYFGFATIPLNEIAGLLATRVWLDVPGAGIAPTVLLGDVIAPTVVLDEFVKKYRRPSSMRIILQRQNSDYRLVPELFLDLDLAVVAEIGVTSASAGMEIWHDVGITAAEVYSTMPPAGS